MQMMTLMLKNGALFLILIAFALNSQAATPNAEAPKGGVFNYNTEFEPPTLHPMMSADIYATRIRAFMQENLAARNPETNELEPRLAERWEISKDNKIFTFFLRKGAKFHDGAEVTAEDVKFSFDAIFEPKYEAAKLRSFYEGIAKLEVVDRYTVKAYAKDNYFKNFDVVAGLEIIPKHIYGDVEKSRKMTRTYVGAGPYTLEKFERGQLISMKRFEPWFTSVGVNWKGFYNFDQINVRFFKDETLQLEQLKKGEIDLLEDMRPEAFVQKAVGPEWGKTVLKKQVENDAPVAYGFIGWNFRRELFQDRGTRVALAHLLNRDEINKKYNFGLAEPARGPVFNKSEYASPKVKAIPFDLKKAQKLLKKSGWKDEDKNGVLERSIGGKKTEFRFSLMYASKDTEKYWIMYREDLKRAGIDMELKYFEWNSFLSLMDERNFDAVALAWGGGDLLWDPKQIWHSSSAVAGGQNIIAYKNPEVDKLIDEARVITDRTKRREVLRKVYELIAEDAPYAFLNNVKYKLYAVNARIQQPAETFKYELSYMTWWIPRP